MGRVWANEQTIEWAVGGGWASERMMLRVDIDEQ